jgi:thiol-disulfide isomerase/thioredoxin
MSSKSVRFTGSQIIGGDNSFISKIKNFASTLTLKSLVIFFAILLFIGLSIYLYRKYLVPKLKPKYTDNNEHSGFASGNNQAQLLLFSVDWCPHCKTAKPIWEELKAEYENKTINGYTVIFTDINCTNESPEVEKMMNTYKIEGYPTIKLIKDGQVIEYDAKPSKATLEQFLNTVL